MSLTETPTLHMPPQLDAEPRSAPAVPSPDPAQALRDACERIAPAWPLDRSIAVNPFWSLTDRPIDQVAAELRALSGARMLMPRAWYREERAAGRLTDRDLAEALERRGSSATLAQLLQALEQDEPVVARRSRVVDVVDAGRDLGHEVSWREFVVNGISQFCAATFDDGQAGLAPGRESGLYASWRRQALGDKGPRLLMGMRSYESLAARLPETACALLHTALEDLQVPAEHWTSYLAGLLLDVNGWASWCAYRRWTARLGGGDDAAVEELLAVRLAWEWLLHQGGGEPLARIWQHAMAGWPACDAAAATQDVDWIFQEALELAWQRDVIHELPAGLATPRPTAVAAQAVFCIDVRSEVFRRALEAESPTVQTLGFAGFFGLPVDYLPLGGADARPQLPGLLAPSLRLADVGAGADEPARRAERLGVASAWNTLRTGALSTFAFVEGLGLTYAWKLLKAGLGRAVRPLDEAGLSRSAAARRKPRLVGHVDGRATSADERAELAAGILRGMGLTHGFARLVLLSGHGSTTRNNPHAAGLDCGACCGQTGEVNARAAAALFNEPAVRAGLAARGIELPESTRFVAGLHDTTTDEVTLFDLDELPESHAGDLAQLRAWLAAAGARARRERAPRLGLADLDDDRLQAAVRTRSRDWSQVRPEWGLADNAGFVVAPREHSRHLDLGGRSFLHDYRADEDPEFAILEQIMTAPMVVTHWINFQYYASTVDNARYGSGNKVLHNVVGGHLGVFEGNAGDLRIGLSLQSLHDGEHWMHTPRRLSVFIEAPRAAIDGVLAKHAHVRALVDNGWLRLFQLDAAEAAVHARGAKGWERR